MIPLFNAIILDIAVIVCLLLVVFLGVVKGVRHTLINYILLLGSIALAFAPFMSILRSPIIDVLSTKIVLGAGVSEEIKLGVSLSYNFVVSLALAILFYILFRVIKCLICMLIKRRKSQDNVLEKRPSVVSRIFGGVLGMILNGVIIVVTLSIFANPIIGGNKTLENSYVAKHIENADDMVVEFIKPDGSLNNFEDKLFINLLKGDLYTKVSDESAKDIQSISALVNDENFIPSDAKDIERVLDSLYHLLRFVDEHMLDEKGKAVVGFEDAVDLTKDLVNKAINEMNDLHTGSNLIEAENTLAVSNLLKKMGMLEMAAILENIFVIK